jgi:hypothetical protein
MKVEIVKTRRIHARTRSSIQKSALLPVIDAWYAYVRTPVPLFYFASCSSPAKELADQLVDSVSRTLDRFPFYAGTITPHSVESDHDRKRARLTWGGTDEPGAEFIEAKTTGTLRALLPPTEKESGPFLWDRTGASPKALFPTKPPSTSAVRLQVTTFACGGWVLGLDFDHGLADAHTIGLFLQSLSANYNQNTSFPETSLNTQYLQPYAEPPAGLTDNEIVQKALNLPTKRPGYRTIGADKQSDVKKTQSESNGQAYFSMQNVQGRVSCMMHIPATQYETITKDVQDRARMQVTDQAALIGFLWAALNRARSNAGRDTIALHMPFSLRRSLELPNGHLGCPVLSAMLPGTAEGADAMYDAAKLTVEIVTSLAKYDEDGIRALIYLASLLDSPSGANRPAEGHEIMMFTSGVQFGTSDLSFNSARPVFFSPGALPLDNLFVMIESLPPAGDEAGATSGKWYEHGVNLFVRLPENVFDALSSDEAFQEFQIISAM